MSREGPRPAVLTTHFCFLRGCLVCHHRKSTGLGVMILPLAPRRASVLHLLNGHTDEVDSKTCPSCVTFCRNPLEWADTSTHVHAYAHAYIRWYSWMAQASKLTKLEYNSIATEMKLSALTIPPIFSSPFPPMPTVDSGRSLPGLARRLKYCGPSLTAHPQTHGSWNQFPQRVVHILAA